MLSSFAFSQTVTFKEIKLKPSPRLYNTKDSTIIYPTVVTKNSAINKLINDEIKKEIINIDNKKTSLKKDLIELTNERIINLFYKVTFNKNWLLSLNICQEGCGAYCTSWYTYFNFDLKTGRRIKTSDLIYETKLDSFKKIVFEEKVSLLKKYKEKEQNLLIRKEIDSSLYDWAMKVVDNFCINELEIENFYLSDKYMEITDQCEFPHAIKSQEPDYHLQYSYKSIQDFLKPEFRYRLLK